MIPDRPRALLVVTVLACSPLACGQDSGEVAGTDAGSPVAAAEPASEPTSPRVSPETQIVEAAPEAPADPEAEPLADPNPEAPSPTPEPSATGTAEPGSVGPAIVPITAVAATPVTVAWRSLASPSEPLRLVPLAAGVVAQGSSGVYELDDGGQLVLRPEIEAWPSYAALIGEWPDDVWYVERREKPDVDERADGAFEQLRLMRLRGGKRWVPQAYAGEQRFDDYGHDLHKGARGGLIVELEGNLTRVAGAADDPQLGEHKGTIVSFVETRSGRVYTLSREAGHIWAQRDCADQACVDASAVQLPLGDAWRFGAPVPRQRHSVSLVAVVDPPEAGPAAHLLHYEAGGWKLDALGRADEPTSLWASKDGGLWVALANQLWHRDPDGGWREVSLPAGVGQFSAAMRADQGELLLATNLASGPAVFAIHSNVQDPPPAAEPAPVG